MCPEPPDLDIPPPSEPRDDAPRLTPRGVSGLQFRIAQSQDDVCEAWRLVYLNYLETGLIKPNPHRIHTAPHAVGPHSVVIVGEISDLIVSTLTAMVDPPTGQGLPLDRVYRQELHQLRQKGRRLLEVGLFADRRRQLARSAEALFQLMRVAFYYGLNQKVTDFVIGVHPRHARFYVRSFGFEAFGQPKVYPAVNDRPVQLLRGDLELRLSEKPLHPALEYFVANPIDETVFTKRFILQDQSLAETPIEAFLQDQAKSNSLPTERVLGQAG